MSQLTIETRIKHGQLLINNIPFADETDVKVIVIPKVNLKKMSFAQIQALTKPIKGNLSDDIIHVQGSPCTPVQGSPCTPEKRLILVVIAH